MDWSKTKTIFIVVFAILNLFLYTLYLDKYTRAQNIQPLNDATTAERLKEDDITIPELPTEAEELPYVSAHEFQYAVSEFSAPEDANVQVSEENVLNVFLNEPVPVSEEITPEELKGFVEQYVPDGDAYTLWSVDEEQNEAVFFQTFEDVGELPLYYSDEGMITVRWDELDNEIYSYSQTMLTEVDPGDQEKKLITALQAIQNLYQQNMLRVGTEVTEASLGYAPYSVLAQSSQGGIYTFVPAWRIEAQLPDDTTENYFINALEGDIIQLPPPEPAVQQ